MNSDSEDDALHWDGDDALEARRPAPRRREVPPAREESRGDTADVTPEAVAMHPESPRHPGGDADDEAEGVGTATLVLLGILGGVYLLYTVGWVIAGVGMQAKAMFMLPAPLYLASMWIAVLAPVLWFTATLLLTRGARDWVRIVALFVGALLLVPWPFVVAGGGGAL
ncbi:hypothetical protein [Microbacterium sp. USHLN186]|uniref:hypothetical protein n=1 Tax=Microbacterium sp. USHLN186 TaxID=3081286 RepID=UPI003016CA23